MATRIYLRSEGSAPVTPADWEIADQINALTLPATLQQNTGSAMTSKTEATGTTNPTTRAMFRWVIGPLRTATQISGTLKGQMRASESNAGANATLAISAKVIKPDGTDRGILLAPAASDSATAGHEFTTSLTNQKFEDSAESATLTLSAVTPTAGDYLVIEVGFRSATSVSRNITQSYGNDSATDLPEDTRTTEANNPWVEFSGTIDFSQDVTNGTRAAAATVSSPSLAYAVAAAALAAATALFAPTVSTGLSVTGGTVASGSTLFAPTVAQVVTLDTPRQQMLDNAVYQEDGARNQYQRDPEVVDSGQDWLRSTRLYEPTVTPRVDPPVISGTTVNVPTVAYRVDLPAIASGSQLYAPTVTTGAGQDVTGGTIASGAQLYAPTIQVGDYTLSLPVISGTVVTAPEVAYAVTGATIASGSAATAPSVAHEVDLPAIASGATLTPPSLAQEVDLPTLAATTTLYAPSLSSGLVGGTISAGTVLLPPSVVQEVSLPTTGGATLTPPTVIQPGDQAVETPAPIQGTATFAPVVSTGAVTLLQGTVAGTVVTAPALAHEVTTPAPVATTVLTPPTVTTSSDVEGPTLGPTAVLSPPSVAHEGPAVVGGDVLLVARVDTSAYPARVDPTPYPARVGPPLVARVGESAPYPARWDDDEVHPARST